MGKRHTEISGLLLAAPFTGQHVCVKQMSAQLTEKHVAFLLTVGFISYTICCEAVSVAVFNSLLSLCLDMFKGCTVHSGCYLYCTAVGAASQCHTGCL